MISKNKKILFQLFDLCGVNALFRFLNRDKALILWYHGISSDDFKLLKGYDERHIPVSLFEKQLNYLIAKGYSFVTLSQLVDKLKAKSALKKLVVLTFDDGFRNIVENAYPVMRKLNAKGCFFLVSNLIGQNKLLWTDHIEMVIRSCQENHFSFSFKGEAVVYPLTTKESREQAMQDIKRKLRTLTDQERKEHMRQFIIKDMDSVPKEFLLCSWEQISSLDKNILEVGSHTRNHPNCATLTRDEEFEEELKGSKADLEAKVEYEVKNFCYPAGSYDENVIRFVKKYGYESAVTIIPGFNDTQTDLYQLKRISIDEDFLFFKSLVSGSYFFMSGLLSRLRGKT